MRLNEMSYFVTPTYTPSSLHRSRPARHLLRQVGVLATAVLMLAALAYAPPAGAFGSSEPQPGPPSVNAGGYMTCGVRADNIAACWGANEGQNPNPTEGPGQATPPAGVTFTEVNAGYSHGCGVVTDGTLACWGSNHNGASTPPAGTFTHVAPGFVFTCALASDATAECWGTNDAGQVSSVPATETFSQLTVGVRHACGLRSSDGTIVCWGSNTYGQVANVPAGTFSHVNSGNFDVCALRESADPAVDGTAVCWGRNAGAQATTPAGAFTQISAGFRHVCGLRPDGTATCWGVDGVGQASPPAGTFNNVSAGTFHSCGMRTDNTAVCWGDNAQGRVAPTMTSNPATPVATVATPYSHQFTSTYMSPAATWTVIAGTLPPGLTLSSDGLLSGTPTKGGVYADITVAGTNGLAPAATETFTIVVAGDPGAKGLVTCTVNSLGNCVVDRVEAQMDETTT